ncbi:MAG: tetratricopeptide repeat protein, partial [Pseudomonadota bacterium]
MQEPVKHPWEVERRRRERLKLRILSAVAVAVIVVISAVGIALIPEAGPSADEQWAEAQAAIEAGKLDAAVVHLRSTLQAAPDHAQARERLGDLLLNGADPAGAEKEYRRAVALGAMRPTDARLLKAMFQQGQHEAIIASLGVSGDLDADQHAVVGMSYLALSRHDGAKAHFEQAIRLEPTHVSARLGGIEAMAMTGELARAYQQLEVLYREAPRFDVAMSKGRLAAETHRFEAAHDAYAHALKQQPRSTEARLNTVGMLLELGRYDDVAPKLRPLVKPKIRISRAGYFQGLSHFYAGRYDEARRSLLNTLTVDQNHLPSVALLGLTHLRLG